MVAVVSGGIRLLDVSGQYQIVLPDSPTCLWWESLSFAWQYPHCGEVVLLGSKALVDWLMLSKLTKTHGSGPGEEPLFLLVY